MRSDIIYNNNNIKYLIPYFYNLSNISEGFTVSEAWQGLKTIVFGFEWLTIVAVIASNG